MKPISSLLIFVCLSVFCCKVGFAQTMPQLVQQVNFELGLGEVLSSEKQKAFLVISGDNYTLVNQASKIQLGTLVFDAGGWGAQGVGKTTFWGDSSILISTAFALMQANPITGQVDTFFCQNKYPEIIEGFAPWPGNENKILIHTKTYPLKKDSTITCFSDNEEEIEYLGPVNCKLYLYDAATKNTTQLASTPHLITAFAPQLYNGQLLVGTLAGDVVQIDENLQQTTLLHAFDSSIHQLLTCGDYITAVPAGAAKLVGKNYGGDRVCFFKDGKKVKEIVFEEQNPADKFSMLSPSAKVFRAFYHQQTNSVLVNYGFSQLTSINLSTFNFVHIPIPYNTAKFYCFGTDGGQLLAAMDSKQDVFLSARWQGLFDLESRKFQPAFKNIETQDKYSQFYKTFDAQGNYHILAYKSDYSSDTIIVFSSNKTEPTVIACRLCKFTIDEGSNMLGMQKFNNAKEGHLLYDKLHKSNYTIDYYSPSEIIKPVFNTNKASKLPSQIYSINKVAETEYVITGDDNLMVLNTNGDALIDVKVEGKLISGKVVVVSPSQKYMAIASGGKKHSLEIWDITTHKKIYTKRFDKGEEIQHFTFDKTRDVLWYNTQRWIKGDIITEVYNVDMPTLKEAFVFTDPRFFSFEVDMQGDRIAFEAYDNIYIAQLSNLKVLWQKMPRQNYYKVSHQRDGFAFSAEKEHHTVLHDTTYLYFSTYSGGKAVEVANNYLYKGDKSSINNLAFVYKGKGYLPADYDVYFNRPDAVLGFSGATNKEFAHLLSEAYAKRRRKLAVTGLNDLLTKNPQVTIANKNKLPYVINSNNILLDIIAQSEFADIAALHIIANGVPVYGTNGLPLSVGKTGSFSQNVILQKGNNTIQVYAMDVEGIKSSTETINIVAEYETPAPKTYFIGIGIDKFKDSAHNLSYSVKDIRDLAIALSNKLGNDVVIDTLFNQDVTVENVQALRKKLLQTGVNDRVIVSYSGHGLLNKNFDYYLSTYNINFRKPEENGLAYGFLEHLLDSLPTRKKLLLIDACHSGEVDKEELDNMQVAFADTAQKLKNGSKSGIELLFDEEQTVGLKNSFELMQEVFADIGRGIGATIISAAAGTQVAYERGELENGVFTYCVLQMLNNRPTCTVQELKTYVSREVERLTNGLQKPTSRAETAGFDWQVW